MQILYISYDGMTDPLGDSQVLSYLIPLAQSGYKIDLISYEKPDRFSKGKPDVEAKIAGTSLSWHPQMYHQTPPILGTLFDLRNGWRTIKRLKLNYANTIVHCRGYISAILGQRMKHQFDSKFIFDMRGWWPDEKKESGYWNGKIYDKVYNFFKKKELSYMQDADLTVSLTEAGKKYMVNQLEIASEKIGVIPTCVNLDVFPAFDSSTRDLVRKQLGTATNSHLILYSGSLGANYPTQLLVNIFHKLKQSGSHLLVVTQTDHEWVKESLAANGIDQKQFTVVAADRTEVYKYVMAADVGIIFYRPAFSVLGRNPTKLSEYWACGLPAVGQKGVGDLDLLASTYSYGLNLFDVKHDLSVTLDTLSLETDRDKLRLAAVHYGSLQKGVEFYINCYRQLEK